MTHRYALVIVEGKGKLVTGHHWSSILNDLNVCSSKGNKHGRSLGGILARRSFGPFLIRIRANGPASKQDKTRKPRLSRCERIRRGPAEGLFAHIREEKCKTCREFLLDLLRDWDLQLRRN